MQITIDSTIHAYTDGACHTQKKIGGWGLVLSRTDSEGTPKRLERSGGARNTTGNQMELIATINALEIIHKKHSDKPIILTTSNQYVQKGITEWIASWKAKGWLNANKKPIKNIEHWKRLDKLSSDLNIEWKWVSSEKNNLESTRAEVLAAWAKETVLNKIQ